MNNTIQFKHIVACLEENDIFIFTHSRNKRMYKKRAWEIGKVFFNSQLNCWVYMQSQDWSIGYETMIIIASLLKDLNKGKIKCDFERKEFELL